MQKFWLGPKDSAILLGLGSALVEKCLSKSPDLREMTALLTWHDVMICDVYNMNTCVLCLMVGWCVKMNCHLRHVQEPIDQLKVLEEGDRDHIIKVASLCLYSGQSSLSGDT